MEDVKAKIKAAKHKAEEYEEIFDPQNLFNVADIIVENRLLIDKVDAILGREDKSNIYAHSSHHDGPSMIGSSKTNLNLTKAEEDELSELS